MSVLTDIWFMRDIVLPVLDVGIIAFIIYKSYQILVQTRAVQLIKGAFAVVLVYALAFFLNLETLLWIMNQIAPGVVIGIAVIFQPELRKIFTRIGQGRLLSFAGASEPQQIEAVLSAASELADRRRGALIVFARTVGSRALSETGTRLDADVSSALLLTIFSYDTALHDGAVIIEEGKIVTAGSFLPLSEQVDIRRSFGSRHRAALGLAEDSDAVVLVVSEETGALSLAHDANLSYDMTIDEARQSLTDLLNVRSRKAVGEEVTAFEK